MVESKSWIFNFFQCLSLSHFLKFCKMSSYAPFKYTSLNLFFNLWKPLKLYLMQRTVCISTLVCQKAQWGLWMHRNSVHVRLRHFNTFPCSLGNRDASIKDSPFPLAALGYPSGVSGRTSTLTLKFKGEDWRENRCILCLWQLILNCLCWKGSRR